MDGASPSVKAATVGAVGGAAWFVAAVAKAAWLETVFCAMIAGGFWLAAIGLRSPPSGPGKAAAGVGLVALATALPYAFYGVPAGFGLPGLAAAASVGGLVFAAIALAAPPSGFSRGLLPAALGAAALGALYPVLAFDLAGPSLWTPGNVLVMAGTAWLAVAFTRAKR